MVMSVENNVSKWDFDYANLTFLLFTILLSKSYLSYSCTCQLS